MRVNNNESKLFTFLLIIFFIFLFSKSPKVDKSKTYNYGPFTNYVSDQGGGKAWKMLKITDKGGRGVKQMLTMLTKGGGWSGEC